MQKMVYECINLKKDSTYLDTLELGIQDGNVLSKPLFSFRPNEKLYSKIFQMDGTIDTVFRRTYFDYDSLGDSLINIREEEEYIGLIKSFVVNNTKHEVLRQPRCLFCKYNPNFYEFYHKDYGLILSMSKYHKRILKSLPSGEAGIEDLAALLIKIREDTLFSDKDLLFPKKTRKNFARLQEKSSS